MALPVQFEGQVQDADNFRFFVASSDYVRFSQSDKGQNGLVIAFGDDDFLDPEQPYLSSAFGVLPSDDLKVKAAQLRELADWFDSQAE